MSGEVAGGGAATFLVSIIAVLLLKVRAQDKVCDPAVDNDKPFSVSGVVLCLRCPICQGGTGIALVTRMSKLKRSRPNTVAPAVDLADAHRPSTVDPRLPHERDEAAEKNAPATRDVIKQGHDDLANGQTDTDCRNKTEEIIEKKSSRPLRKREP
jgi:hypothetical protein